jgi:hypothetical protein
MFNQSGQVTSSTYTNSMNYPTFSKICDNMNLNDNYHLLNRSFQRKKIPIKIILNDDEEVSSVSSVGNNTETTDENSIYQYQAFVNGNSTGKN